MSGPEEPMAGAKELAALLELRAAAADAARPAAVESRHRAGKLTARERIEGLIDDGSFLEFGLQVESDPGADGSVPGDGVVCGTATIGAAPAAVVAFDRSIFDGRLTRLGHEKIERMVFLANEHRWPFVCFVEGAGERESERSKSGPWTSGRIGLFDGLSELSGAAPIVAVAAGSCDGVQLAIAMCADFVVATAGSSFGPPRAEVPVETYELSGEVDLIVDDEPAAVDAVRHYLGCLGSDEASGEVSATADDIGRIIPDDRRRSYDMRRVIDAIADQASVLVTRPRWAPSLITSLARIGGRSVGIFANQPLSRWAGAIDADAADKMTRFIELCSAYDLPVISLIDSPGFAIGPDAEVAGIARHHIRTLNAIHFRTVPLYCVQLRKAYGLGPVVMRGQSGRKPPELRLAWPTVETGGMSLEGAAYIVRRAEIRAAKTPQEARAIRDEYADTIRRTESGIRAGQNFSFDEIIDPADTRARLMAMLRLSTRPARGPKRFYLDTV